MKLQNTHTLHMSFSEQEINFIVAVPGFAVVLCITPIECSISFNYQGY